MIQKAMSDVSWVPLLVPDMPAPNELLPYLEKMHHAKHYSNFGPLVRELESEFSQKFAIPHEQLTTVANATQGIELTLRALDLPEQARVLVPAFTFVATATAVVRAGYTPVLADVDAHTWLMTPEIARSVCEKIRIDAVLTVATFGMPHDMHEWQKFEEEMGVPVIIDAAAAYGSQWLQGAHGTLVFSLHTTKSLPAGEGGLVVSTRPELAMKVKQLSNFGINLNPAKELPVGALASVGSNSKMSEYHAAVGLISLAKWEKHAEVRRSLYFDFSAALSKAAHGRLIWQKPGASGPIMAPTVLCACFSGKNYRSILEQLCIQEKITTRRWYQPLLKDMPVLRKYCHVLSVPNAEFLAETMVGLPFFLNMQNADQQKILGVVSEAYRKVMLQ